MAATHSGNKKPTVMGLLAVFMMAFLGGASALTAADQQFLEEEIRSVIESDRDMLPKFVRLSFHDCVDGCNGCVDMSNADNAGLHIPIDALNAVLANNNAPANVTRADVWALAGLVAARRGAELAGNTNLDFAFRWGRTDCDDPGNTEEVLPSALTTGTDALFAFFNEKFGFDATETAVLMGAHTLGRAHPQFSGFEGSWTANPHALDNDFYRELSGPWRQVSVPLDEANCDRLNLQDECEVLQWREGGGGGGGGGRGRKLLRQPLQAGRFEGNFMLNTDMALISHIEPRANGRVNGNAGNLPAAETADVVAQYRRNNQNGAWQRAFEGVFVRMVEVCTTYNTPCVLQETA